MWLLSGSLMCGLLSDPNALLEGLRDDGMINMLHLKWKWHVS